MNPGTGKQTVRVTIFDQTYAVSTSGDAAETERLAQEVDDLMSSIARRSGNLDATRAAVLACLHLADRLQDAERELNELKLAIGDRTRHLATRLDEACGTGNSEDAGVLLETAESADVGE